MVTGVRKATSGVLSVKWLPPQNLVSNQMVAEEYNFPRQFYEFSFWDLSREQIGETSGWSVGYT